MSYCINPKCPNRQNPDEVDHCLACGTSLLLPGRYRLVKPLRALEDWRHTEIFLADDGGTTKVLKSLRHNTFLTQFEREMLTLSQLQHPGIPEIDPDGYFDQLLSSGETIPCLMMEHIPGENLQRYIEQHGPISEPLALEWLKQLTEILEQVHHANLFHRDIKPSNVMRRPDGQLTLIDFGTVRPVTNTYLAKVDSRCEITSVVSPGYTPLEQIEGKAVPQSDFYALGRLLVFLLTGQSPNQFKTDEHTGELFWREDAPQISHWLAILISDLMATFPGYRPKNAQEILQRLEAGPRWPTQRLSLRTYRWVAASVFVLNIGLLCLQGFFIWERYQDASQPEAALSLEATLNNHSL
ncbi:MAG: serine/threonine-protein kinase [Cyanobacteria bacterium J06635_15]